MNKKIVILFIFLNLFIPVLIKSEQTELEQELRKTDIINHIHTHGLTLNEFLKNIDQYIDKENGITALMYSAHQGHINLVNLLLKHGADFLIKTLPTAKQVSPNWTAFDFANGNKQKQISQLLLHKMFPLLDSFLDCKKIHYSNQRKFENYLTIVGVAKFNDGLGRIPISIIDCLHKDIKINFINTKTIDTPLDYQDIPQNILPIILKNFYRLSKVVLFSEFQAQNTKHIAKNLTKKNRIKILYSMFESSKIPSEWVDIFNSSFHAIVVPDEFLVNVYKNSGVKVPIFVLPIPLYLDEFLNKPEKKAHNKFFTFGCLCSFDKRKNQELLIRAFAKEFGNSKNVILKINGRVFSNDKLKKLINKLKIRNIILTHENLSWKNYIKFMESLDCYVNLAKGEGFSITPREALALGIPCILANNTAQTTLCNSGFVEPIKCNILERATYPGVFNATKDLGFFYNCSINDVRNALRKVYNNYDQYLTKAKKGREWVRQYSLHNLKQKYLNLVKPELIIYGKNNVITNDYLMTSSIELFNNIR